MIVVIRFPKDTKPVVVTTFEGHDEQTQKDANELASILSRKNKCEYKVLGVGYSLFSFLQCTKSNFPSSIL